MSQMEESGDSIGNVDQMVEMDYEDRLLPVPLTDRERLEMCEDIAVAQMKAEQAELDKKAADENFKGIIEGAYADVSNLTKIIRYGKKEAMVQTRIKKDYRLGWITIHRMDDMTELQSRPMTKDERQMGINFDMGNGKA
jgi:hypothetical protein